MKKKVLSIFLLLSLVGCTISNPVSSLEESTSESSSELTSQKDSSFSSEDTTSEKVTSEENTSVIISDIESSFSSSSEENVNTDYKLGYGYHPSSEPSFNKQLKIYNHIGDVNSVWNYYRGEGVSLAVIDSGFDINHPEFKNRDGSSRISSRSVSITTKNGSTTRSIGRDKVGITDGDSHGTMCEGLAASGVNGKGIVGIASECELVLIKVDKKVNSIADAFKYCGDNNIRVASISLGAYPSSSGESSGDIIFDAGVNLKTAFNDSINYAFNKGVTIVAATGNSKTTDVSYPAGCDNVIGAGGTMAGSSTLIWDEGYEGSNYNGNIKYVDVFSPSSGIYAPGFDTSKNQSTYWDEGKGTSFSAPIVAGAATLYFQKYPNKTNVDFENALRSTCVNISSYNGNKDMGYGRLDVGKLLNIHEDIEKVEYSPTTTKNKLATKLHFTDEAGWNIRTLHIYDLTFESGYGYYDFERFMDYQYGRVSTSSYLLEGTTKCWAYSDEGWSGDYFINIGNNVHAQQTTYDYYFPWWVKSMTYQFVNNSNWLPVEGLKMNSNNGYGKVINSYFWYKDNGNDTGIVDVVGESCTYNYPAIKVNINGDVETSIIFDYYENENCYYDNSKKVQYIRSVLTKDTTLFK